MTPTSNMASHQPPWPTCNDCTISKSRSMLTLSLSLSLLGWFEGIRISLVSSVCKVFSWIFLKSFWMTQLFLESRLALLLELEMDLRKLFRFSLLLAKHISSKFVWFVSSKLSRSDFELLASSWRLFSFEEFLLHKFRSPL